MSGIENPCNHQARCRGFVTVMAMFVVAVALMLSGALLHSQSTGTSISRNVVRHAEARAVTESGLEMVVREIRQNPDWRTSYTEGVLIRDEPYAGGVFTVSLYDGLDSNRDGKVESDGDLADDVDDPVTILVRGEVDGVTHESRATLIPTVDTNISITGANVDGRIQLKHRSIIDSFDSRKGPYSALNSGDEALVSTNRTNPNSVQIKFPARILGDVLVGPGANPNVVISEPGNVSGSTRALVRPMAMPAVTAPPDTEVGPNLGNLGVANGSTVVINSNRHYRDLRVEAQGRIDIDGDVVIYVEDDFTLGGEARVTLRPDSSLTLYCADRFELDNKAEFNHNTGEPSRVKIMVLNTGEVTLGQDSQTHGTIVAGPSVRVTLFKQASVYGKFVGGSLLMHELSRLHLDINPGYGTFDTDTSGNTRYRVSWHEP